MIIFILIAAAVFAADISIKHRIEAMPAQAFPKETVCGIRLVRRRNSGFMMNRHSDRPRLVRAVSAVVMAFILAVFAAVFSGKGRVIEKLGMALAAGGAASNVYERLVKGFVVDYINIPIGKLKKIAFNIADICIAAGALMVLLYEIICGD